jgi:hypothetical protein
MCLSQQRPIGLTIQALSLKTALLKKEEPAPQKKKRMVIEEDNDVSGPKIRDVSESESEDEEEEGEYDPDAKFHKASKFKGA